MTENARDLTVSEEWTKSGATVASWRMILAIFFFGAFWNCNVPAKLAQKVKHRLFTYLDLPPIQTSFRLPLQPAEAGPVHPFLDLDHLNLGFGS